MKKIRFFLIPARLIGFMSPNAANMFREESAYASGPTGEPGMKDAVHTTSHTAAAQEDTFYTDDELLLQ